MSVTLDDTLPDGRWSNSHFFVQKNNNKTNALCVRAHIFLVCVLCGRVPDWQLPADLSRSSSYLVFLVQDADFQQRKEKAVDSLETVKVG